MDSTFRRSVHSPERRPRGPRTSLEDKEVYNETTYDLTGSRAPPSKYVSGEVR